MNARIRNKLEAARNCPHPDRQPESACDRLQKIQPLLERLYHGEKTHKLTDIATRHNIPYATIHRHFSAMNQKTPGSLLRFGRVLRVSDAAYRRWLLAALAYPMAAAICIAAIFCSSPQNFA